MNTLHSRILTLKPDWKYEIMTLSQVIAIGKPEWIKVPAAARSDSIHYAQKEAVSAFKIQFRVDITKISH